MQQILPDTPPTVGREVMQRRVSSKLHSPMLHFSIPKHQFFAARFRQGSAPTPRKTRCRVRKKPG